MTEVAQIPEPEAAQTLIGDYLRSRKEDIPTILKPHLPADFSISQTKRSLKHDAGHIRQQKHLDA
jgi:hypothetical protein